MFRNVKLIEEKKPILHHYTLYDMVLQEVTHNKYLLTEDYPDIKHN